MNKKDLLKFYEISDGIVSSTYPEGKEESIHYKIDSIIGWHRVLKNYIEKFHLENLVLDLGCGTGHWSREVGKKYDLVSCDISLRALRIAKKDGNSIGYIKCDVEKLPFKSGSFSSLISIALLEHVIDDLNVINEVKRILKNGGLGIFNVPNERLFFLGKTFWLSKFGFKKTPWDRSEGHLREFSKSKIKELSEKSGMELVDVSYSWIIIAPIASLIAGLNQDFLEKDNKFSRFILKSLGKIQDIEHLIEKFPMSSNINFVLKKN